MPEIQKANKLEPHLLTPHKVSNFGKTGLSQTITNTLFWSPNWFLDLKASSAEAVSPSPVNQNSPTSDHGVHRCRRPSLPLSAAARELSVILPSRDNPSLEPLSYLHTSIIRALAIMDPRGGGGVFWSSPWSAGVPKHSETHSLCGRWFNGGVMLVFLSCSAAQREPFL